VENRKFQGAVFGVNPRESAFVQSGILALLLPAWNSKLVFISRKVANKMSVQLTAQYHVVSLLQESHASYRN
jgi:hypothetical protein